MLVVLTTSLLPNNSVWKRHFSSWKQAFRCNMSRGRHASLGVITWSIPMYLSHDLKQKCPVPLRVLDIGTGSGCIAVTLALDLWNSSVSAWDISGEALLTARENAHRLQAQVNFEWHDVLSLDEAALAATPFDIIVSNPPYVCDRERKDMTEQVLAHEPHTALFVPDNDPLLFYRAIADYGTTHLNPHGLLAFEINPLFAKEMCEMLESKGYEQVEVKTDQYGKERVVIGVAR